MKWFAAAVLLYLVVRGKFSIYLDFATKPANAGASGGGGVGERVVGEDGAH